MKKTYINPTLDIVKIATQMMLAVSNPEFDKNGETPTMEGRESDLDDDF